MPAVGWTSTAAAIVSVGRRVVNYSHLIWMAARHFEMDPLAAMFAVPVDGETVGLVGIHLVVPLTTSMRVIRCVSAGPERAGRACRHMAVLPDAPPGFAETASN